MRIGLIGYGGVGKAFIRLLKEKNIGCDVVFILNSKGGIIDDKGLNLEDILVFENNIRNHDSWNEGLTYSDLLDKNIDFLVELTPTNKETGEPALSYIKYALKNKVNVVTGNKGPILNAYIELKNLANENNVHLGIGCTTGGALPSISGGLIDCAGSDIISIEGILNGTTNYILKEMEDKNISYSESLKSAQELGIAETNPSLDVEGYDTATKMIILANVLMGANLNIKDVNILGITKISLGEINKAKLENKKIKLLGRAYRKDNEIYVSVCPTKLSEEHPLYLVDGKNKGVYYNTDTLGDITIIGGASGTRNAAASILRDIINIHNKL